ncbi:DUF3768 domain-containing protein, partial [Paracoccus versutus]|nr:DUF3768 domain-containing protein [Paracoccus versutus]
PASRPLTVRQSAAGRAAPSPLRSGKSTGLFPDQTGEATPIADRGTKTPPPSQEKGQIMALLATVAPGEGDETVAIIAAQNDCFRRTLGHGAQWNGQPLLGKAVTTPGFRALPEIIQIALTSEVVNFKAFDADNDPYGDHSFGVVEMNGHRAFWKVDVYDTDYTFGVSLPDATDPHQVRRVLTLYLPSEH